MNKQKHFLNKLCTTGLITLLIGGSTVAFADPNSAQQKTANKITQVTNSDSKAKLDVEKDIYTHLVQNDHFTSAAAVAVTGYMGFESDFIPYYTETLEWTLQHLSDASAERLRAWIKDDPNLTNRYFYEVDLVALLS